MITIKHSERARMLCYDVLMDEDDRWTLASDPDAETLSVVAPRRLPNRNLDWRILPSLRTCAVSVRAAITTTTVSRRSDPEPST